MEGSQSVESRLAQWQRLHDLGKKPGTIKFHKEVLDTIRANLDCSQLVESVTDQIIAECAQQVTHFCPSRWNAIVTVLRFVTPCAGQLKRRKLRFRDFTPPTPAQFASMLEELDKIPQSNAGLIVRFLVLTGLRIGEAKKLRIENIKENHIAVPALIAKSGKARSIPFVRGVAKVIKALLDAPGRNGLLLSKPHIRKAVQTACRKAGLPYLSPHCFRHMFATSCIESGVDIPTVARWLGHQDGGALLSRMYFHLLDRHSRLMAAKVRIRV